MRALALFLLLLATPARADVATVIDDHILPGYQAFASASAAFAETAEQSCDHAALLPAYNATFDAWTGVQHLRLGPVETDGRVLAIHFWPDPKGLGTKAQMALLQGDAAGLEPERMAEASVAARGLMAMERLLFPAKPLPADPCPLIRASAQDLARIAAQVLAEWQGGFADLLRQAGAEGNSVYLSEMEARQALFTQLATGMEQITDARLGRPLGTFDAPAPQKAEAIASNRSLRNITLALQAMRAMTLALDGSAVQSLAAFDSAIAQAAALDDPVLAGVANPMGRLKVEILQQSASAVRAALLAELAVNLGVGLGFNAADGD